MLHNVNQFIQPQNLKFNQKFEIVCVSKYLETDKTNSTDETARIKKKFFETELY